MRRAIALIVAGVLVLAIALPVSADPGRNTAPYDISCPGGVEWSVNARGLPGWDQDWGPGDVPWLLVGYTITDNSGELFTRVPPLGLEKIGKLYGPCTITGDGWDPGWWVTGAQFLVMEPHDT